MKSLCILLIVLLNSIIVFSQTFIHGKVTDQESGEELIYANIMLSQNGVLTIKSHTDFEGYYNIEVEPGTYDLEIHYTGYTDKLIKDVLILAGEQKEYNIQFDPNEGQLICCPIICCFKVPLIKQDNPGSEHTIDSEQIKNQGTKNINELILSTPGVSLSSF